MKRYSSLIVSGLLLLSVFTPLFISSNSRASESFGVGVIPANPDPENPRTKSIFVHTAEPGETIQDAVTVINRTDEQKEVSLYAVDSQIASDGAFSCAQAADTKQAVGSWVDIPRTRVTMEPKQTRTIDFELKVPSQVDVGEHNGCLVVQDATTQRVGDEQGITLSFRSALRIALTIPGDINAELSLVDVEQKYKDQQILFVSPSFKNEGNVSLDVNIKTSLRSIFGRTKADAGGQFPVLADTTGKFNFEVDRPYWGGFYKRVIEADYAQLAQRGQEDEQRSIEPVSKWVFVMPHTNALAAEIILFTAIVAGLVVYLRKRHMHNELAQNTKNYIVKQDVNIQLIAKKHHISWKALAKINNIKPPYSIAKGDVIKIPDHKKQTKKKR